MITALIKIDWLGWAVTWYGNGYVALPPWHKYHGVEYDDIPVEVHGWLTFAVMMNDDRLETQGFRHIPNGYWIIWFDTAHWWDNPTTQNREYVLREIDSLVEQLKPITIWKKYKNLLSQSISRFFLS